MATFYIDYENVHNAGLNGIDLLTDKEYVYLLYTPNANTVNMDSLKMFLSSRCGIDFLEASCGTPNALDFQLITLLYSCIDQDDYHYIISKDQGFNAAIHMGKRLGFDNVLRFSTIVEAYRHYENIRKAAEIPVEKSEEESTEERENNTSPNFVDDIIQERIQAMVRDETGLVLTNEELAFLCEAVGTSDNKLKLFHYLRKQLGSKRGTSIYKAINEAFTELKINLAG